MEFKVGDKVVSDDINASIPTFILGKEYTIETIEVEITNNDVIAWAILKEIGDEYCFDLKGFTLVDGIDYFSITKDISSGCA